MADRTLKAFSNFILSYPSAYTFSLIAFDLIAFGSFELIAVGDSCRAVKELREVQRYFLPEGIYGFKDENLESISDFIKSLPGTENGVAYYLCRNSTCERPTRDISDVIRKLNTSP